MCVILKLFAGGGAGGSRHPRQMGWSLRRAVWRVCQRLPQLRLPMLSINPSSKQAHSPVQACLRLLRARLQVYACGHVSLHSTRHVFLRESKSLGVCACGHAFLPSTKLLCLRWCISLEDLTSGHASPHSTKLLCLRWCIFLEVFAAGRVSFHFVWLLVMPHCFWQCCLQSLRASLVLRVIRCERVVFNMSGSYST